MTAKLHIALQEVDDTLGYYKSVPLNQALASIAFSIDSAIQNDKDIDRLGWLLANREPICETCDNTGKLPGVKFDNLCPDCTLPHCVDCGQMDGRMVDVGNYLLCPKCERELRNPS